MEWTWSAIGVIVGAALAGGVSFMLLHSKLRDARLELESDRLRTELKGREMQHQARAEAESEMQSKRIALERHEEKLLLREGSLEERRTLLDQREGALLEEARRLREREQQSEQKLRETERELERIAGLDRETARDLYLQRLEADFKEIGTRRAKEVLSQSVLEAERKAKRTLLDTMERSSVQTVSEATIAVVTLPNEEMKGRLIGREGRNIRSFEQVTGADLIIDDTPEAVVVSCFDPIRRETARLALMNLVMDGRIHPGRIEELYEKAQEEVGRVVVEAGERAAVRAGIPDLDPRVSEMMGKLRFRTSYAQNVLDHSVEVASMAVAIAHELDLNIEVCRLAGFLHDIGKALPAEFEGPHALSGMEYLRQHGYRDGVTHAVGAHHHDIEPITPEAVAVIVADSVSAARPGARRESLENYVKRLASLEALANGFPGVERSYALQAGREIRLIVRPEQVDDLGAARLAAEVAKRIEADMEYPGQIKVTVIRETRVQEIAK